MTREREGFFTGMSHDGGGGARSDEDVNIMQSSRGILRWVMKGNIAELNRDSFIVHRERVVAAIL